MKTILFLVLTALLFGCSARFPRVWNRGEPEISDVVAQLGGEEYVTGVKEIAPPEALETYRQAIIANAGELLHDSSDKPLLTIHKVDILNVSAGDPTIVKATVVGEVSESDENWMYRYNGKRIAQFDADYLFTLDNKFIRVRDSALREVYDEL